MPIRHPYAGELVFTAFSGSSLDLPDRIRVYKDSDTIIFKKENKPLREIGKKDKQSGDDNIFFDLQAYKQPVSAQRMTASRTFSFLPQAQMRR